MRLLAPRDDLRVGAGLAAVGRVARAPLLRSVGEERVVQEAEEVVQGEGEVGVLVPVEEVGAAAQPDEGARHPMRSRNACLTSWSSAATRVTAVRYLTASSWHCTLRW